MYWSIVSLVLGSCLGSFLNVLIYRWPRGLSICQPRRSFGPCCGQSIAWYDNIPVVSFVLLGGRCRHCRAPISRQYPLVELGTALVFLMSYDAFFVARQRIGLGDLGADWPILLAHWSLWGGLIALAVMDLEAYMVDIRITWAVAFAGLLGHTFWTPASSAAWLRPGAAVAACSGAVVIGLLTGAWLFLRGPAGETEPPPESPWPAEQPVRRATESAISTWLLLGLSILAVVAYLVAMSVGGSQRPLVVTPDVGIDYRVPGVDQGVFRLMGGLVFLFLALALLASRPQPQADVEIVQDIMAGAADARRNALWELKLLSPAIILGAGVVVAMSGHAAMYEHLEDWLRWQPYGDWRPLWGLATALAGWVIGGMIGWISRIFFTLAFGKEALGMGDVHILAAAGAVAGWPVALLGFFLASLLCLLALVVIRLRRQSRALPYGPWLGLGFFLAAMFQDRILLYLGFGWIF